MATNIGPVIRVDGEKEYRAQMKSIIQQTKTLDSEMKLLISSFDESTSSEERAGQTAAVLTKKIAAQEEAVALLQKQLEASKDATGENSVETQKYQELLNKAQTELNNTQSELKNLKSGLDSTGDSMADASNDAENLQDSLSDMGDGLDEGRSGASAFKDIFTGTFIANTATSALKLFGEKLKDFAKESIEAAASVSALESSFSQTFGEMEGSARQAIANVSEETGIMSERLMESGQKIYAFNKASGADSADALSLMERALSTAADTAAYYDTSVEQATETLLSFLKGNYANDAALGISSTEYTRNAKAVEMYGVSFNELTETMKQNVLLQTVEDANKLSGAVGQAARESDSWANVQGNLNEAWKQFQATLGNPVLEMLTPIVKLATNALIALNEALSPTEAEVLIETNKELVQSYEQLKAEMASNAQDASDLADRIFASAGSAKVGTKEFEALKVQVNSLNQLVPGLNLQLDEQTGALNMSADAVRDFLDASDGYDDYAATQEHLADVEQARIDVETQLEEINRQLEEAGIGTKDAADQMIEANGTLTATEVGLLDNREDLLAQQEQLNSEYDTASQHLADLEAQGYNVAASNEAQAESYNTLPESMTPYIQKLSELGLEYQAAYDSALSSIKGQMSIWREFSTETDVTAATVIQNMQAQTTYANTYSANMKSLLERPIAGIENFVASISDGSAESGALLEEMTGMTDTEVSELVEAFNQRESAQENMAKTMGGAQTGIDEKTADLITAAGDASDQMIDAIKNPDDWELAADENMNSYKEGLEAITPDIVSAATSLANQIRDQLSDIQVSIKANVEATPTTSSSTVLNRWNSGYLKAVNKWI